MNQLADTNIERFISQLSYGRCARKRGLQTNIRSFINPPVKRVELGG